jgi:hypothetical protein
MNVVATRRHREMVLKAICPRSPPTHSQVWLESGDQPSGAPCWRIYNKLAQALSDIEAAALAHVHSQRGCEYCECDDCKRRT